MKRPWGWGVSSPRLPSQSRPQASLRRGRRCTEPSETSRIPLPTRSHHAKPPPADAKKRMTGTPLFRQGCFLIISRSITRHRRSLSRYLRVRRLFWDIINLSCPHGCQQQTRWNIYPHPQVPGETAKPLCSKVFPGGRAVISVSVLQRSPQRLPP